MQTKFPYSVMILGVVSSEGHVMPPLLSGGSQGQRRRLHQSPGDGSEALDRPGGTGEVIRLSAGLGSILQGGGDSGVAGREL